ncbi:hypothetical protein B484DRAFT_305778, partial [Ochromonadaceae sp. CCMP2298]
FTGTMAQNQSIFDPIFWVHHSNIERYLCSWQRLWTSPTSGSTPPPDEVMTTVLYPWTKPADVARGDLSWNTEDAHGTFAEWFDAGKTPAGLPYEFDDYYIPTVPFRPHTPSKKIRILATILRKLRGGELHLYRHEKRIATLSLLSAVGTGCARCSS